HLALGLDNARVGAPPAASILERPLLDDLRAELLRRALIGRAERNILGMRADNEEPFPPLLPDQIFGESVGQHRARGRGVNDIGAAVFLARTLVRRAGVEHQAVTRSVGDLDKL